MLIYGYNEIISKWVSKEIGLADLGCDSKAIGIVKNDRVIAGVVYNNYILSPRNLPISIEMSIASIDKSWCTAHNLRALFAYPFIQLNVKRVQATTREDTLHTRKFLERLGFTFEGIGREAHPLGGNAAVYSMLQPECRWLNNGQRLFETSCGTRPSSNRSRSRRS